MVKVRLRLEGLRRSRCHAGVVRGQAYPCMLIGVTEADAAGMAAGHDHIGGVCPTGPDSLTRGRWGPHHPTWLPWSASTGALSTNGCSSSCMRACRSWQINLALVVRAAHGRQTWTGKHTRASPADHGPPSLRGSCGLPGSDTTKHHVCGGEYRTPGLLGADAGPVSTAALRPLIMPRSTPPHTTHGPPDPGCTRRGGGGEGRGAPAHGNGRSKPHLRCIRKWLDTCHTLYS